MSVCVCVCGVCISLVPVPFQHGLEPHTVCHTQYTVLTRHVALVSSEPRRAFTHHRTVRLVYARSPVPAALARTTVHWLGDVITARASSILREAFARITPWGIHAGSTVVTADHRVLTFIDVLITRLPAPAVFTDTEKLSADAVTVAKLAARRADAEVGELAVGPREA